MLLSFIILITASFMFGYYWRDVWDRIRGLEKLLINLRTKRMDSELPTGSVIEPDEDDPVAQARREFDAIQEKLNGKK